MSSTPRAFNEIPSAALRSAILGAVLSALAERSVNEQARALTEPSLLNDAEFKFGPRVELGTDAKRTADLVKALFSALPLCDDPSCEACMAERAARGAASKAPNSATAIAQRALEQAAKALADATAAVEGAAKALALATPERA